VKKSIISGLLSIVMLMSILYGVTTVVADDKEIPTFGSDEELTELLGDILKHYKGVDISVGLCYTKTGETIFCNPDNWYQPASIYKLPLVMKVANSLSKGDAEQFEHCFSTDIEEAVHDILKYSDNTFSLALKSTFKENELSENVCAMACMEPAKELLEKLNKPEYSPVVVMNILKNLYANSEQYPNIIQYMTEASAGKYLRDKLEKDYVIAQKYGSVESVNHIAGIIYRENPILVVVMSEGVGSIAGERLISRCAVVVNDYAQTLDERVAEYEKENGEIEPAMYSEKPVVIEKNKKNK